ncbi:unnamed protein product [Schistocephalus solidus]|uniref:guanylate cyclase n=1 Tax=Schistocephalus solidus TaxID=70667 RepID=A0A183TJV1_SCHSO|nr:unnamed protein product [Schistocephalus solidus]
MYGFLILIFKKIVENEFGEEAWECLLEQSGLRLRIFQTRRKYWDETLLQLFKVYAQELDIKLEQVAYENGLFFHEFVECAGYGNLLKIQGRNFLGFLEQIDNLHEYLKFSYPRIRSPSFLVLDSSETHISLLYESTRCGYTPYVQGQLTAIARQIYATEISVDCKPSVQVGAVYKTILEIRCLKGGWSEKSTFPNQEVALMEQPGFSSLGSDFLSLFAFHLLITEDMTIQHVGRSMCLLDSNLVGADFRSKFTFIRPFIEPSFEKVSYLIPVYFSHIRMQAFERAFRSPAKTAPFTQISSKVVQICLIDVHRLYKFNYILENTCKKHSCTYLGKEALYGRLNRKRE